MAAYIPVPRDLTRVKSKVLFNLTKRQLLCFGAAALIGLPVFFLVKTTGNVSLAAISMIIVMLPLFFLAMYEKDGMHLERILLNIVTVRFFRPAVRRYETENLYETPKDRPVAAKPPAPAKKKGEKKRVRKKEKQ